MSINRIKWLIRQFKLRKLYKKTVPFILFVMVICSYQVSDAKKVKRYVGELMCSTYYVSDNTPRGTRDTATGARATEYYTIAVDRYNPIFNYGADVEVDGFGRGKVQDNGNLNHHNVDLDLFTAEGDGYKEYRKVWIWTEETKEEKAKRKAKERRKYRKDTMPVFVYDEALAEHQIITDPDYISGGAAIMDVYILDVIDTEKGLGNVIKTGSKEISMTCNHKKFTDVIENAVG